VIVNICQQILPQCAPDTIFVTVLFLPPVVIKEDTTILKNTPTTIDILKNGDKSFDGIPLSVNPVPVVAPLHGTMVGNPDGTFTYTPNLDYVGKDIVIYSVCDKQTSSQCGNDTVFITVIPPTILTNEHHTIARGGTVTNNLSTNDFASDGKPLSIDVNPILNPQHGTIEIKPNGSYTYIANKGYVGGLDSVKVNVCDHQTPPRCGVEVIYITITPSNDLPVANDDNIVGTLGIDTIRGNVGTNDKLSVDGPNDWRPTGSPVVDKWMDATDSNGVPVGKVLLNLDGSYVYVPKPGYTGTGYFTYKIRDAVDSDEDDATVYITIGEISIPEGFSPNGDGIHDLFVIKGIEGFKNNFFTILNRWGNKVYEANPYNNTWDGTSMFGLRFGGNILPIGTYFYILDLHNGMKAYKGTIYLNR
jgi:gliding motility-associated-like protein